MSSTALPKRSTRGLRMNKLLEDEDSADEEFWGQDAFAEESGDEEYSSESEEADVFDKDFDDDESSSDSEEVVVAKERRKPALKAPERKAPPAPRAAATATKERAKKPPRGLDGMSGAFYTLFPIRPRWRGERRSLRTLPGASLRPHLGFNPRPRRLSTPTDAFELHPDVRSYGPSTLSVLPRRPRVERRRRSARRQRRRAAEVVAREREADPEREREEQGGEEEQGAAEADGARGAGAAADAG